MNKRILKRAIGVSYGKTLTVENDCGAAHIYLERDEATRAVTYRVETDGFLDRVFDTPEKALAFALYDLATSMDGSPNR